MSLYELIKRNDIEEIKIFDHITDLIDLKVYNHEALEQVLMEIKYEGYIAKTYKDVEKLLKLESKQIPVDINYAKVSNLASEARQKLESIRPVSIAQASRISGVNPSDIAILAVYLRKEYGKDE